MARRDTDRRTREDAQGPQGAPPAERLPVDVLAEQMALAKLARLTNEWAAYERARETAIRLALSHRIEDEVGRFRQVMAACTSWQNRGEDARKLIHKRLSNAFTEGIERRDSPRDVIVGMQRIPRAAAITTIISDMRRGDGEACIALLLCEDGHLDDEVRAAFGDDPARIAARFTDRDWAQFARPLMAITPGELRPDIIAAARQSLRATLSGIASARGEQRNEKSR